MTIIWRILCAFWNPLLFLHCITGSALPFWTAFPWNIPPTVWGITGRTASASRQREETRACPCSLSPAKFMKESPVFRVFRRPLAGRMSVPAWKFCAGIPIRGWKPSFCIRPLRRRTSSPEACALSTAERNPCILQRFTAPAWIWTTRILTWCPFTAPGRGSVRYRLCL